MYERMKIWLIVTALILDGLIFTLPSRTQLSSRIPICECKVTKLGRHLFGPYVFGYHCPLCGFNVKDPKEQTILIPIVTPQPDTAQEHLQSVNQDQ